MNTDSNFPAHLFDEIDCVAPRAIDELLKEYSLDGIEGCLGLGDHSLQGAQEALKILVQAIDRDYIQPALSVPSGEMGRVVTSKVFGFVREIGVFESVARKLGVRFVSEPDKQATVSKTEDYLRAILGEDAVARHRYAHETAVRAERLSNRNRHIVLPSEARAEDAQHLNDFVIFMGVFGYALLIVCGLAAQRCQDAVNSLELALFLLEEGATNAYLAARAGWELRHPEPEVSDIEGDVVPDIEGIEIAESA